MKEKEVLLCWLRVKQPNLNESDIFYVLLKKIQFIDMIRHFL